MAQIWHSPKGFKSKSKESLDIWQKAIDGELLWVCAEEHKETGEEFPVEAESLEYLDFLTQQGHLIKN